MVCVWQECQADLERVIVEDPPQVQGAEEEHTEHSRDREDLAQVGARNVARTEHS